MHSLFQKVVAFERLQGYSTHRSLFIAVVLELGHAISRGRKPNSCSLLPGINIREYLQEAFFLVQSGYRDHTGDACSLADDVDDLCWGWQNEDDKTIIHAIRLVRKHLLKPQKLPLDLRGNFDYQSRNPNSRLNRAKEKTRWEEDSGYDDHPILRHEVALA